MSSVVSGFQHVALVTGDLDQLISFYRDVFEAERVVILPGDEGSPFTRHALVDIADGVHLHPFERPGADLDAWGSSMFDRGRLDHFAIRARDRASFDKLRARLVERGASDGEITDFGAVLSVGFTDPDGARLELCWVNESVPLEDAREPAGFQARS